jgi:hypothetical protein
LINTGRLLYIGVETFTNRLTEVKPILLTTLLTILAMTTAFASDAIVKDILVYKNPECGCCNKWVRYLEDQGYNVTVEQTRNVLEVKQRLGVPEKLAACHTAVIDGYVVEGHITHRDIKRLLLLRPEVTGISVPGMPIGTPGMERGNSKQPYDVISFDEQGNTELFVAH